MTALDYMNVRVVHVHLVYTSIHWVRMQLAMMTGLPCLLAQSQNRQQTSPYETASLQTYQLLFLSPLAFLKLNLGMMDLRLWPLG